jgi:hypothetical protein
LAAAGLPQAFGDSADSHRVQQYRSRQSMNTRRLIGLCLVPVLLAALDGSVTLAGQSAAYWTGEHSRVLEGTPGFRMLLTHGPAAYMAGLMLWVLAFVGLILLLPSTPALAVCLMFTLGHTIGAFSWINRFPHGREFPVFINAITAVGLALGIRWWVRSPRDDRPLGAGLPNTIRWAVIVMLCSVPILYTWPR